MLSEDANQVRLLYKSDYNQIKLTNVFPHEVLHSTNMMSPDFSADEDKDCDHKQSLMNLLGLEESLETTQGVCQEGPVTLTLLRNAISVAADFDSLEVKSREPEVHSTGSNYYSAYPVSSTVPLQSSSVFYILQPASTPRVPSFLPAARTSAFSGSSCSPQDTVFASSPISAHFACDTGASNKPHPSSSAVGTVEQPPPLCSRASTSSVDSANAPGHKRATSDGELRGREILAHVFELQKQREQTGFRSTLDPEQLVTLRNAFISNPKPSKKERWRLVSETKLPIRFITVWFQNQRAKMKRRIGDAQFNSVLQSCRVMQPSKSSPADKEPALQNSHNDPLES